MVEIKNGFSLYPVEVFTGHVGWWTRVHYPTCPLKIITTWFYLKEKLTRYLVRKLLKVIQTFFYLPWSPKKIMIIINFFKKRIYILFGCWECAVLQVYVISNDKANC